MSVSMEAYYGSLYEDLVNDAVQREAVISRLQYQATHDNLTGLPDRKGLSIRFEDAQHDERNEGSGSLLFIDLDGFGEVNKRLDYKTGDRVLVAAAEAIKSLNDSVRGTDTVARLGGDEFVVLMPGANEQIAADRAELICKLIANEVQTEATGIPIGASIGVVGFDRYSSLEEIRHQADQAMRRAKELGKGAVQLFSALNK